MSKIPVTKTVFGRDFSKVVDTEFRQLLQKSTDENKEIGVTEFFQLYEDLFYQIAKTGDSESHTYILNKTVDYLGVKLASDVDVNALLEEITNLRQELLDTNKALNEAIGGEE